MKSIFILIVANFVYGSVLSVAIFRGGSPLSPSKLFDRSLPPLVPPKFVGGEEDDDFDERDVNLSPAHVQLRPSYWAPTLETLAPEEAEFYRKALVSALIGGARNPMKRDAAGRSMSMLRMGRSSEGSDGVRRSMTMLRMGRAFDQEEEEEAEEAAKRSMGMLRMGRRGATEEDFRKSMSMLRMGRRAAEEEEDDAEDDDSDHQHQQLRRSMGMLRMGRSLSTDQQQHQDEEAGKRSMGMLRMGRALVSKNVDRGALNMLRMGKRGLAPSADDERNGSREATRGGEQDKKSSPSSTSN